MVVQAFQGRRERPALTAIMEQITYLIVRMGEEMEEMVAQEGMEVKGGVEAREETVGVLC